MDIAVNAVTKMKVALLEYEPIPYTKGAALYS